MREWQRKPEPGRRVSNKFWFKLLIPATPVTIPAEGHDRSAFRIRISRSHEKYLNYMCTCSTNGNNNNNNSNNNDNDIRARGGKYATKFVTSRLGRQIAK